MRSWLLCISAGVLAGVSNAACTNKCGSNKCLGAIAADPAFGESFCSSWLALEPATTTVTEVETVTSTLLNVETALTTLTVTTATFTVYVVCFLHYINTYLLLTHIPMQDWQRTFDHLPEASSHHHRS